MSEENKQRDGKADVSSENKVEFKIRLNHDEPIELQTMAISLLSFQSLMDNFIGVEHGITDSKIYLEKVEIGSDIYSLIFKIAGECLPFIPPLKALNELIGLIKSFKELKDKPIKELETNPHLSPQNANLLKNIVAPVVINQNTYQISHAGKVIFNLNTNEAKEILQNTEYISKKEPIKYQSKHENALIKMYKTTNTSKRVKHKAKCDELSPYAVSVIFDNETLAEQILSNPYGYYFLVDLECYRDENEKVILYRAYKLKNKIEIEKENNE